MVNGTNEESETVFPAILSWILLKAADRPTNTVVAQDQLEAPARMNPLVVGDFNNRSDVLPTLGVQMFENRSHCRTFPNCSKIRPSPRNVPIRQKEISRFTGRFG